MKIAIITNLRAPYRTLQINEFSKLDNTQITVYYTDNKKENRIWNTNKTNGFKEVDLDGFNIFDKYGYINKGIFKLVEENDVIFLGGYEKPTYILISRICKLLKKPYVLVYDGISINKIEEKEKKLKKMIKNIVIKDAEYIMGNGTVSKRYFNEKFGYSVDKIYNQYLSVDKEKIDELYLEKNRYREEYRAKLGIDKDEKVLIYSGRLIDIKNVDSVIKAISKINKKDITFLIIGGGELEKNLMELSQKIGVKTIITGFMKEQKEVFKHYFVGDSFILPSIEEAWGLAVNEAMHTGLPVLVSNRCGCSLDLVKKNHNGYTIDSKDINDIATKIEMIISEGCQMGYNSREVISEWNFSNSAMNFKKIVEKIKSNKII